MRSTSQSWIEIIKLKTLTTLEAVKRYAYYIRRQASFPPIPLAVLAVAALFVLSWLALAVAHELAVVLAARVLVWSTALPVIQGAVAWAPGDDLHALLALRMIGDLQFERMAINLPGGPLLISLLPGLFAPSTWLPDDAWISAVFTSSSSAVGIHVARLLVNALFVISGALLTTTVEWQRSLRQLRSWPPLAILALCLGVLAQAYGAASQFHLTWADASGGGMLLSMVATKVFRLSNDAYDSLMFFDGLFLSFIANTFVLGLSFLFALAGRHFLRLSPRQNLGFKRPRQIPLLVLPARVPGPLTLVLAVMLFQTPLKHAAAFGPAPMLEYENTSIFVEGPETVEEEAPAPKPSKVTVTRGADGFEYRVNGVRAYIRGVGYNPVTLDEDLEARLDRYSRDFSSIRASGVNTILGWDQREFDEVLLSKAAQHGLGIILPFDLKPSWPYDDPAFKAQLMEEIRAWVERYKGSPSLRMWGLGNEVIHGIGGAHSPKSKAFARFLVQASDHIHKLDPEHPVIYRDSEDVFLPPVAKALAADNVERPWFVYGMNFFTNRIGPALQNGPSTQFQHALLISEFGPAGVAPHARPEAYLHQWTLIRSFPHRVLGGSAYVWATDGPEPLDRSFGLTDENGSPVDSSLPALASVFLKEKSVEEAVPRHARFFLAQPKRGELIPLRWGQPVRR